MKRKFCTIAVILINWIASMAQSPSWEWARRGGKNSDDYGMSIAVSGNGNSYVTGVFWSDSIVFSGVTLFNAGECDFFVLKYNASGNLVWAKSIGGTTTDYSRSITLDVFGNFYITGFFDSPVMYFDTIALINSNSFGNHSDIYVAKFNSSGTVLWAKRVGNSAGSERGMSVTTDDEGKLYVTGNFNTPYLSFGGIPLTNTDTIMGNDDIFIAKYSSFGNVLWAKSAGGPGVKQSSKIAVDANKNIFIAGYFDGDSITFGNNVLMNAGGTYPYDLFITKYDSSGNVVWAKRAGGASGPQGIASDAAYGISTDANGNAYATGWFNSSTLTFGSTTLINTGGGSKFFIVKYDAAGNAVWAKSATGSAGGLNIVTDSNGNSYVTGTIFGTVAFGNTILTCAGYVDVLVVKYDSSGNALWAQSAGGTDADYGMSIAVDTSGYSYVTGRYTSSPAYFGSISLSHAPGNSFDVFTAKLGNITAMWEQNNSFDAINVFPNPTTNHFTITFPNTINKGVIEIYNVMGVPINIGINENIFNASQKEVQVENIEAGIYFVKVTCPEEIGRDGEKEYVKKVVIDK